jgi:hypothetical protein
MRSVTALPAAAVFAGPGSELFADPAEVPGEPFGGLLGGSRGGPGAPATRDWLTRRHVGFAAGTLVVLWLFLTFAQGVARSTAATDQVAQMRAANAALADELDAGQRELSLVRGRAFARLEARAHGMGRPGERVFSLAEGAPPPPAITPLGANPAAELSTTPLEDWLAVLLGR